MRTELLLLACLAGCQATAESDTRSLAEQIAQARDRMHVRFRSATSMQLAIALGDLDRAHAETTKISQLEEPDFLPEWRPYLESIRGAAQQVARSGDTVAAAKTMAQLGRSCARCHEASHAKIVFPRQPAPPEDPRLAPQMASHQWAAARMWEGLIGPSDDRWLEGARTMARSRTTIVAESGELGIADDAARTRLMAERATRLGDPDERATLYGEMLATCAHCHHAIRDR